MEATDEDLPTGWVKRRRSNGSIYYHNTITDMVKDDPPHAVPLGLPAPSAGSRPAYQVGNRHYEIDVRLRFFMDHVWEQRDINHLACAFTVSTYSV